MDNQPSSDEKGSEELAFEAHMEHYKAIRQDIIQWSGFQNNLVNYAITVTGGSVVLFSIQTSQGNPILSEYPFILLIVSILLSMITWASMEAEVHIHDGLEYSDRVLRRKVQKLIGFNLPDQYQVLQADIAEVSRKNTTRSIFRGILVSGKFLVAYLPALAYLFIYILSFPTPTGSPWYVQVLVWTAIVAAVMIPLALVSQVLYVTQHYWGKEEPEKSVRHKAPLKQDTSVEEVKRLL